MNIIRTNVMSLAMLVGSALGFGAGVALAQEKTTSMTPEKARDFRQEPHHYKREGVGAGIADVLKAGVLALRPRPAPREPDSRYQEGSDGGYQERFDGGYHEGYHVAFRHGFDDGFYGRQYENRANTRGEYLGYEEGYRKGKAKSFFMN